MLSVGGRKVPARELFARPGFLERFRQESQAAANLPTPTLSPSMISACDNELTFIVMEMSGTDLKTLIKQRGRFTPEEACHCLSRPRRHRLCPPAGLVHCDVKPQNMLVTPDMRLKVTDFGIARALSTIHPQEQSDVIWGSPQYFSPEQASVCRPSPASDVYSLGVIMYEMLTGSLLSMRIPPRKLAHLHIEAEPVPIAEMLPNISPVLEQDPEKSPFQATFPALPDSRSARTRPAELRKR